MKTKVTINNETREIECDVFKLSNTLWNKPGEKYTEEEMFEMGLIKK